MPTYFKSTKWLIIGIIFFASLTSCKKYARVETLPYISLSPTSFQLEGNLSDDGGSKIYDRGFCWGEMKSPGLDNSKVLSVSGKTGVFSKVIDGLEYNTDYYVRAFAKNKHGVVYGETVLVASEAIPYTTPNCNPLANVLNLNGWNMDMSLVTVGSGSNSWSLEAYGPSSHLEVLFQKEPKTGNYPVVEAVYYFGSIVIGKSECTFMGGFGSGTNYICDVNPGDTVHVVNYGNGKFSMTFCNLTFTSTGSPSSYTFDGRLKN